MATWRWRMTERHACPRKGCNRTIDNRLFCCAEDWFALTKQCRVRIGQTAQMSLLSGPRRRAIKAAREEWEALDGAVS